MSGTSPNLLLRRFFTVTIAGLRSSLAGAGVVPGFATPFRTIAGTSIRTGFFFRGGRLYR
jgi:hypothetical protein